MPLWAHKQYKIMKIIWKFQKFLLYLYCSSLKKWKCDKLKYGGLVKLVKMFAHQYSGEIASKSVKVK